MAFLAVLAGFAGNGLRMRAIRRDHPEWSNHLIFQVSSATLVGVVLLLFMGNFGHNLFRYSWLWYGGFLLIARHCAEERLGVLDDAEDDDEPPPWADEIDADAADAEDADELVAA